MARARPFLRHGSEQYRTRRPRFGARSAPHCLHCALPARFLPYMALRRADEARRRAAWTARFSGSARYRRMYSRIRARLPSARQGCEQYTGGLLRIALEGNALPHTRHLAVRAWRGGGRGRDRGGDAAEAAMALLRRRADALFWHRLEQYTTDRRGVLNGRPHSPHRGRCTLEISLSAFFPHRAQ